MKCAMCGGEFRTATTDLPFKVSDTTIVRKKIDKGTLFFVADSETGEPLAGIEVDFFGYRQQGLPLVQCASCPEYLIEDEVLRRVDEILARVEGGTELEIVRYAA